MQSQQGDGLKLLGGRPSRGTTGHLQSSMYRLQAPTVTGAHNVYFHLVQDDMNKTHSVNKDWQFVSKGTEISLGRFVSEYFTSLTLDTKTGVVSDEDTEEIWESVRYRCGGGREVFLDQRTRWLGGQQENEGNHPPRIQEDN